MARAGFFEADDAKDCIKSFVSKARLDALPATAMLAVARVVMARSSHEYRHHTAVVANLMQ